MSSDTLFVIRTFHNICFYISIPLDPPPLPSERGALYASIDVQPCSHIGIFVHGINSDDAQRGMQTDLTPSLPGIGMHDMGYIMNAQEMIVHHTTEEILSHPRFQECREVYIDNCIDVYKIEGFPGKSSADAGRVTTLAIIVCLHARYIEDDRETWPTLKRLKETVADFGFASPRFIDDFVARLVQTEFLELRHHPADSRVRLLVPTEALLRWDREWMAAHFEPLAVLFPEPGYALAIDRSPAFQKAHGGASVPVLEGAVKVAWRNLDVVFFLAATSALSILFTLCRLGGETTESGVREADLAVLAPQFGVSRSHIRNMLLAAEQHGFLARHGDKGQFIVLTPRWIAAFDRFIADSLSYSDLTYRLGCEALMKQNQS
ncbi:hypothetical protein [Methylobacterium tarhaniae]|nr:hypothetical protein [Methylobacterium tarhaniae]